MVSICHYESPLGGVLLAADEIGLTGLWFDGQKYFARGLPADRVERETPALLEAKRWLDIYFSGKEPDFTPPLHPVPAVGVGNPAANSLRKNHNLRRNCEAAFRKDGAFPDVRAGGRRRGGAQQNCHHHSLPSGCRHERQSDGLRRRN